MKKPSGLKKEPISTKRTWDSRISIPDAGATISMLRAAGLPLSCTVDTEEGESDNSKFVCIAEIRDDIIHAIVASPSGLVYRFEPTEFEQYFWGFAARNYYFVTGNIHDRRHVAELAGVDLKDIKGKTLIRGKSEMLSQMTLDVMLGLLIPQTEPQQKSLLEA